MEEELPTSFERQQDGSIKLSFRALPNVAMPDMEDLDNFGNLELLRTTTTQAVHRQMSLVMHSGLVEGGTVAYGPGGEEGIIDLHAATADDPLEAIQWMHVHQSLMLLLELLNNTFPIHEE